MNEQKRPEKALNGGSDSNVELDVRFITEPDAVGYGRIIFNSRFYGLPMPLVLEYMRLLREVADLREIMAGEPDH